MWDSNYEDNTKAYFWNTGRKMEEWLWNSLSDFGNSFLFCMPVSGIPDRISGLMKYFP